MSKAQSKPNHVPRARRPTRRKKGLFAGDFFIPVLGESFTAMADGRLTPTMWCVYSMVLRQVDFETGVWWGTAFRIYKDWGGQIHLRTIQDNLNKLCESGALKTFHQKNARGAYPVLVDGYRIRFSTLKGHRLNAGATVDPSNPVYERDDVSAQRPREIQSGDSQKSLPANHEGHPTTANPSSRFRDKQEASAQPQRDDRAIGTRPQRNERAGSATEVRSDPALIASSIARIPDTPDSQDEEDIPNEQEEQDRSHQRHNAPSEPERADSGNLDGVDDGVASSTPTSRTATAVTTESLMAKLRRKFFDYKEFNFSSTAAHRAQVLALATKYGVDAILCSFEYWLGTADDQEFTCQVTNPESGEKEEVPKKWLLKEFMDSGAAVAGIERATAYGGVVSGRTLLFVMLEDFRPEEITPENGRALGWILEHSRQLGSWVSIPEAMSAACVGLPEFLAEAPKYYRECLSRWRAELLQRLRVEHRASQELRNAEFEARELAAWGDYVPPAVG